LIEPMNARPTCSAISEAIQSEFRRRRLDEAAAVDATRWLDDASVLKDSPDRPGRPLRDYLRAGCVAGAEQRPAEAGGRWFIVRVA
jgi:hypothetical protein